MIVNMKIMVLFLVAIMQLVIVSASEVVISQVLYNPAGSDSGGEAVELQNQGITIVDISGWIISTETSIADAIIPEGTTLLPDAYYLIADVGWSTTRDNLMWREADTEQTITLANTNAGVALSNGTDTMDAVGWGDPLQINAGLFEGTPHTGVTDGESLLRSQDTNDNSQDFIAAVANFPVRVLNENEILITAVVGGSAAEILSITITPDDDTDLAGVQIAPVPGSVKPIRVRARVRDAQGHNDITAVTFTFLNQNYTANKTVVDPTTADFEAELNLSYSLLPGLYNVDVIVLDNGFLSSSSASFEYMSLAAISVDSSALTLPGLPGSVVEVIGDIDQSTSNITMTNHGNVPLDILLSATNLTDGLRIIESSQIAFTFNNDYTSAVAGTLGKEVLVSLGLGSAEQRGMSVKLTIPTTTSPGNYTGSISVIGVQS